MLTGSLRSLARWVVRTCFEHIGPVRVLFYVDSEIGFVNQEPLLRLLANDSRFSIGVCTEEAETERAFSDGGLGTLFADYQLPVGKARKQVWHYVVTTSLITTWFRWDFIGVSLGHGSCVSNGHAADEIWHCKTVADGAIGIAFLPGLGHYHALLETRPEILENKSKALFICGVSKLAELLKKGNRKDEFLQRLCLDSARTTVLVSSHWSQMSFLRDIGVSGVRRLCERREMLNVIVTAHPKIWSLKIADGFNGAELLDKLRRLEAQFANLRVVQTGIPFDLMAASDFIVCDHSSIRVEYAHLGRPAALYRNANFVCQSTITDRLYREASEVFSDIAELDEAISRILSPNYDKSDEALVLARYFVADTDGTAGRIRDTLLQCGRVGSVRSTHWARVKKVEHANMVMRPQATEVPVMDASQADQRQPCTSDSLAFRASSVVSDRLRGRGFPHENGNQR